MKDWTGNKKSVWAQLAASNHTDKEREINDYYATDPKALEIFLDKLEQDGIKLHNTIWESACGEGHLVEVLKKRGYTVFASDIIDRGYPDTVLIDFLKYSETDKSVDILTNPPYKCFSGDTECYTKKGWKKYTELNYEDEILSINPNTLEVEWSGINKIIIREFNSLTDKMYHFQKSHLDIMCTNNHRMFAYSKGKLATKNGDLIVSDDIRNTHYIPRTGYFWSGKEIDNFELPAIKGYEYAQPVYKESIKINMDDWLNFFGLWLADGYCRHTKNSFGNFRKTIGIKQIAEKANYVREILNKLPFNVKEYKDTYRINPCINFEIHNEQLWNYLKQFGKSENKFIPQEIKELSARQLKIFLDSYFYDDGSKYYENGRIYRTISKKLIEDLQEINLKLGNLLHITNYEDNKSRKLYTMIFNPKSIYNKIYYSSNRYDAKKVEYSGKVWCVNLKKNGAFLLRRNGCEFISGNCASEFVEKALEVIQDGYYAIFFLKIQFLEGKARKKMFEKYPPKYVYVNSERQLCAMNGDFEKYHSTAVCYCWYIWEKGWKGETTVRWI